MPPRWLNLLATGVMLLSACTAIHSTPPVLPTANGVQTPAPTLSLPTRSDPSPTLTIPPAATLTPVLSLCTPLQGIPLDQLPKAVVNPYHPPHLGSDDPHQGVDLADLYPGSQMARAGMPVQVVLDGRVAMVTSDRFPFGNTLLIETPLEKLPPDWLAKLQLPEPIPTLTPDSPQRSPLTCPDGGLKMTFNPDKRSLYLLYAHLKDQPDSQPGDPVTCGQVIGTIGKSGNALNPHLHLEIRVGPARIRFNSMAHYDASATLEEMANYCTWSISGLFLVVDPLKLLSLGK
jgi:murein DD-endopeptidase MepM/ murein hydrolase activator NlpD